MGMFSKKKKGDGTSPIASRTNAQQLNPLNGPNGTAGPSSSPKIDIPKPPNPDLDPAGYLRSLQSVRERCSIVSAAAKHDSLLHFDVDYSLFKDTASFVVSIIKRDFAPNYSSVPSFGRWQQFNVGGRERIEDLLAEWGPEVDAQEKTRRLLDLFLISCLLDAGAASWQYRSKQSGKYYRRSEGLAVASLEMFKDGMFSSDTTQPCQVDGQGLRRMDMEVLSKGLQVSDSNQLPGIQGRTEILMRLANALNNQEVFGVDARPGNMLDYLLSHPSTQASAVPVVPITTLWSVLLDGLSPIWPESRTILDSTSLGDAWPCGALPGPPRAQPWENIAPLHKHTQWLAYSLITPMTKLMKINFVGQQHLTGLSEYRNGGLFIDTGLMTLKQADLKRGLAAFKQNAKMAGQPSVEVVPLFEANDDVVVEWRACTVGLIDDLLKEVNKLLGFELTLPQLLESTFRAGREIAELSRPNTKEPPIMINSDGTLF